MAPRNARLTLRKVRPMTRLNLLVAILTALTVACGGKNDEKKQDAPAVEDHSGHDHGNDKSDTDAGEDAFAGLSGADAKLAKAQATCPVSGEELGSMGSAIKVMVGEKPVFICCEGCRKKLLASPEKYLAKLEGQ